MRLATIRTSDGNRAARVDGDELVLLDAGDVGELLGSGVEWRRTATADGERVTGEGADFAPVVTRPEKIFGIGLNYAGHAAEAKLPLPEYPVAFAMFWRSLIGAHDDLVLPPNSEMVDWEAELGVIVGTPLRHATVIEAEAAIAGYTIVNDVSMRDWQRRTGQFLQGKTFESSTPVGPFLVTPDEIAHARALDVTCSVDDVLMQNANTSDLIFGPAEILSYLSGVVTLVPGDLVATGTPAGVGGARRPQIYLHAGEVMRTSIAGLGEQVTRCVAAPSEWSA